MRLRILSDLHLEFMRSSWRGFVAHLPRDRDVLVLAGDICAHDMIEGVLTMFARLFPHVIHVMGNHEYYGSCPHTVDAMLRSWEDQPNNLSLLNRSAITISGQRFVGFSAIHHFSPWVYEENARDVAFLNANVRAGDVVVTHYLPSQRCVHPKYAGSPYNSFFVCEIDDIIESFRPALHIHGHTHESVDTMVGETRVVANPYGYFAHETNAEFDPGKTVEV